MHHLCITKFATYIVSEHLQNHLWWLGWLHAGPEHSTVSGLSAITHRWKCKTVAGMVKVLSMAWHV